MTVQDLLAARTRGKDRSQEAPGGFPEHECYGVCSNAWGSLMHQSLPSLITTGVRHPYK